MSAKRVVGILAVNLLVFCVLAEVIGLGIFYLQHGWLFYLDPYRPAYDLIPETRDQALSAIGLHPYFGPTHRPGIPFDIPPELRQDDRQPVNTNNLGFASPHDYPVARANGRQFLVGIFGGSVAGWFCQVGVDRLIADLRQQPFFRDKDIVPLCVSHEGYKQPQQVLLLTYLLSLGQAFDLVVNIDGFNEVTLGSINDQHGWDISMPSFMHLDPLINLVDQSTLTPEKLDALAAIEHDKQRLNWVAARINATRLAAIDIVLERYHAILMARYRAALVTFAALPSNASRTSVIRVTPATRARDATSVFEDIAANWLGSSRLMHDLLAARGVPYVHVLQPNQYYAAPPFTPDQAKVALNAGSPFKPGAERGYPVLVRAMATSGSGAEGGRVFDGTHIFDREPLPVYIDDCCHYTLRGNVLLADFVAAAVLQSDGAWRTAK